jgi:outer membrane protein assembly factor BamB
VASTPVTDGETVYAVFNTGIAAAFSKDGEQRWVRHIEAPPLNFGQSASPVLSDGKLIVHFQHLMALDSKTGKEIWRTKMPAKHGSPVVAAIDDQPVLVTPCGAIVRVRDGQVLAEKLFDLSDNSPLVHDGVIYAHQSGSVKALNLPSTLQSPLELEELWETTVKGDQRMASAALHDGIIYAGNRRGILDALDAETGKLLFQKRLQVGELFPSVSVAGNRIYVFGNDGKAVVLDPGSTYREIGRGQLDRMSGTPIFVGKRIYVRTDQALYCIAKAEEFISEKSKD